MSYWSASQTFSNWGLTEWPPIIAPIYSVKYSKFPNEALSCVQSERSRGGTPLICWWWEGTWRFLKLIYFVPYQCFLGTNLPRDEGCSPPASHQRYAELTWWDAQLGNQVLDGINWSDHRPCSGISLRSGQRKDDSARRSCLCHCKKTIFNVYAPTKGGFSVLQKLTFVSWWEFSTAYLDTLFNKFCWVKMNCQALVNDEKASGNVYMVKIFFASTITLSMKAAKSCPTLCNPMDYTVDGILQARILEWIALPFSGGSSQPRNQTQVSCIAGRFFTNCTVREATIILHYTITLKQDQNFFPKLPGELRSKYPDW